MKDSGIEWIGEIPEEWKLVRTKNIFRSVKRIVGDSHLETERLALTLNGVIKRDKNEAEGLQPEKFDTYQFLYKNELVFKLIDLGNIATSRVGLSQFDGMVSPAYIILHNECLDNRFYLYFFLSMWYRQIFNSLGDNGVRSSLNANDLLNIPIVSTTEAERVKIADFLDDKCAKIDCLIAHEEATIEELKAYKQSVVTEAVTKGLDKSVPMKDSGVEWIGKIPESWEILRIKNLGWTQNGISKSGDFFGQGYPFVSYGDVYKNMVLPRTVNGLIETTEQERNNYSVKENDIFFTRTSETIEEVGFSCVCKETIPNATFAGFLIRLRLFEDKKIQIDYAKYYFRGIQIRNYLVKEMNLVTRASLGQDLLKAMSVTLPPMIEQQQIADYLDKKCADIDSLISIKQQKIEELKEYKKSLIYEYVTGKKEVA